MHNQKLYYNELNQNDVIYKMFKRHFIETSLFKFKNLLMYSVYLYVFNLYFYSIYSPNILHSGI